MSILKLPVCLFAFNLGERMTCTAQNPNRGIKTSLWLRECYFTALCETFASKAARHLCPEHSGAHRVFDGMGKITSEKQSKTSRGSHVDHRDRLILALYAQLRAERETREALEWAIEQGALSPEVLQAMVSDPVPVITSGDVAALERLIARDETGKKRPH